MRRQLCYTPGRTGGSPAGSGRGLNAAVVNRFLLAALAILCDHYDISMKPRGDAQTLSSPDQLAAVTVMLGITGDVEGQFLLGCDIGTALNIARVMMDNPAYPELDDLCVSALSELGNMIGGLTATGLSEMGMLCSLTPPSVVFDSGGKISLGVPLIIALPFSSSVGDLRICVGLRNSGKGGKQ